MNDKKKIQDWILSSKEERLLSEEERSLYFAKLKEYCKKRKLTNTTWGATTIAPKLKRPTNYICRKVCNILAGGNVEVIVDGLENIPEGAVIFASTHQGLLDNFIWIPDCPKHSLIFHGIVKNKALLLAQVNTGLILVEKERSSVTNRINAKLDVMSVLLNGKSVWICPETTWNLSPNRLHLPLNYGFIDIAQKVNVPIVPVVIEYTYDFSKGVNKIIDIHISYGERMVVSEYDSVIKKLNEYEEKISTMRWNLMEEKGLYKRKEIDNWEYINLLKMNVSSLESVDAEIDLERARIQGANQDFYVFHHINDVPWNKKGELLETEETERLKKINMIHGI